MNAEHASSAARRAGFHFRLAARNCPGCGANDGQPFADANIDPEALDAFAFASRKPPEYMHHALVVCRVCSQVAKKCVLSFRIGPPTAPPN